MLAPEALDQGLLLTTLCKTTSGLMPRSIRKEFVFHETLSVDEKPGFEK